MTTNVRSLPVFRHITGILFAILLCVSSVSAQWEMSNNRKVHRPARPTMGPGVQVAVSPGDRVAQGRSCKHMRVRKHIRVKKQPRNATTVLAVPLADRIATQPTRTR